VIFFEFAVGFCKVRGVDAKELAPTCEEETPHEATKPIGEVGGKGLASGAGKSEEAEVD